MDVWRLAPRDDKILKRVFLALYIGPTLKFSMKWTILVTGQTSSISGLIECEENQGELAFLKKLKLSSATRSSDLQFFRVYSSK